jgi:hypothetical protein
MYEFAEILVRQGYQQLECHSLLDSHSERLRQRAILPPRFRRKQPLDGFRRAAPVALAFEPLVWLGIAWEVRGLQLQDFQVSWLFDEQLLPL